MVAIFCYDMGMTREQQQADQEGFIKLSIRLPHDVHGDVKAMSEEERRSLNAQIVWCLQQCARRWKRGRRNDRND